MKKMRVLVAVILLATTTNAQTAGHRTGVKDAHDRYYNNLDSLQKAQQYKPGRQSPGPAKTEAALEQEKSTQKKRLPVKQ